MKVIVKDIQRILDDFFKVDRAVLRFEKYDKIMSEEIVRLNFDRGDSVAAIIVNSAEKKIIFVEQFRYPIYTKDQQDAWVLELVAGVIEKNSSPEDTIIREIMEETGYKVSRVKPLFSFFPSPGGSNEKIYLFYAEVEQTDRIQAGGGIAEEGENIQIREMSFRQAFEMIDSGKIIDAKTIIALQWLRANIKN